LKATDINQNALDVLAESKIREVHVMAEEGRSSFITAPEIKEMGELLIVIRSLSKRYGIDRSSKKELEDLPCGRRKNYEIMQHFLSIEPNGRKRKLSCILAVVH